jgi:sugar phosphate isomerase/epimerase
MRLGIFSKTFAESQLDRVLDAVVAHGLSTVQFNLSCAGLETLPTHIDDATCRRIASEFSERRLEMAAISGTFNMIDPDQSRRGQLMQRARQLIAVAPRLNTRMMTLCTGTCDPGNMWRAHPDNNSLQSWRMLTQSLAELLRVAEDQAVTLGIEPERGNVINSADKARRLLDEMKSPALKIVLDGANLLDPAADASQADVFAEAFHLLGPDIALIHAKETRSGDETALHAIGSGDLNWNAYFDQIVSTGFTGPVIVHGVSAGQVEESLRFVRKLCDDRSVSIH